MELDPFPHNCNILEFNIKEDASRVILTCAICHRNIAVIQNHSVFTPKIKPKKEYPKDEGARYSEKTIMASV